VIGFILVVLSWIVPPQVGWVGTGLWVVPTIGAYVVSRWRTTPPDVRWGLMVRRAQTNPLITAARVVGIILFALSWNRVVPRPVGWAGLGLWVVSETFVRRLRGKKEPKGDDEGRTN
jgi:hypothetical protein